jgi:hypothetical protein
MTYEQAAEKSVGTLGVQWSAHVVRKRALPPYPQSQRDSSFVNRPNPETSDASRDTRHGY